MKHITSVLSFLLLGIALTILPAYAQTTIGAAVFNGVGLNDATSGGTANGMSAYTEFTIIVTGTGMPNQFKWNRNGGSYTTGVNMTGSAQALAGGVTIRFAATTGHTLADQWTITVSIHGTLNGQTTVQSRPSAVARRGEDKLNDVISVRDFGAVGDDVTDDTVAVQAALNAAAAPLVSINSSNQGSKVVFPCKGPAFSYLVTDTIVIPHGVTLMGDVTPGCRIHYRAASSKLAAFLLVQDSVTIRDLKLYSDDTGDMGVVAPKVILLLALAQTGGMPAGETGHHQIHDISVSGWASESLFYQVASEENSFHSIGFYLSGGGAKHVMTISNQDVLGICGGLCPTQTNFHNWYTDLHVVQYPVSTGTATTDSAGVFLDLNGASGDLHFSNIFVGMGPTGGPLMDRHGSCFRMRSADVTFFSGTGSSVQDSGCEGGDQMFYFERNSGLPMGDAGYFTDLTFINDTHQGTGVQFMYAEDNTVIYRCVFLQNKATEPQEPSSFYSMDVSWIHDGGLADLTIRNVLAHSIIEKSFGAVVATTKFDNHMTQSGETIASFLMRNAIDLRWRDSAGTETKVLSLDGDNNVRVGPTTTTANNGYLELWAQGKLSAVLSTYGIVPRLNNVSAFGGTSALWQYIIGGQFISSNHGQLGGTSFTGSGLNDGVFGGGVVTTPMTGSPDVYDVQITATGTPNTFEWRVNGGTWNTGNLITGLAQPVASISTDTGLTIHFAATTGHTIGDKWSVTATNTVGSISLYSTASCATPPEPCNVSILAPPALTGPYYLRMPASPPTSNTFLKATSIAGTEWQTTWDAGASGTVTSVGMTVPSILSVSGSPITNVGTLAVTLATESANTIFAGPTSGGAATPTFRALNLADLPASALLNADSSGSYTLTTSYADVPGVTVTATRGGTWLIGISVNFGQNALDTNMSAQLVVAGSAQSNPITLFATTASTLVGFRQWVITGVTNGDVIKLQAKKNSGSGSSSLGSQTNIVAEWKP